MRKIRGVRRVMVTRRVQDRCYQKDYDCYAAVEIARIVIAHSYILLKC